MSRNKKNILVFTTLFPNNQMEQHALFVKHRILELSKRHDVTVVAPVPFFPPIKISERLYRFSQVVHEEVQGGLRIYHPRYFVIPKILRSLYGWLMRVSLSNFIQKLHLENKFDLIDAHFVYPDGFAAVEIGRELGIPVVVNARGSDINLYSQSTLIRRKLVKTFNRADRIMSVSPSLSQRITELGIPKERINLLENGIDFDVFQPTVKKIQREDLGIELSQKVILSVGNLLEAKGFNDLIQALVHLDSNTHLYIIGKGPYQENLIQLAKDCQVQDRVHLIGAVSQIELNKWYGACDVFALASQREGRPNVVMESIACGRPVVTYKGLGVDDIVSEKCGVLTQDRSIAAISNQIKSVLNKKWDAIDVSRCVDHLTWENCVDRFENLVQDLVTEKNILFFSSDDWFSGLKTSKFHLSTRLGRKNKVLFINSLSLRSPNMSGSDLLKIWNKLKSYFKGVLRVRDNIYVYTPLLIPFQRFAFIRYINKVFLVFQFRWLMKRFNFEKPQVWTFLPNSLDTIRQLQREKLVYYCVDDMSAFKGVAGEMIKSMDRQLTSEADLTFSVSEQLYKSKKELNRESYYSPHGVDFDLFNQAVRIKKLQAPNDIANIKGPVVGFYGLISPDWIDYQLVEYLADKHKDYSFVFIGKVDQLGQDIPQRSNIHYLSVKPYEDLYLYSKQFDAAILPFNVNELTIHSHPLKILEYLSAGKPVVSVDIPEVHKYENVIEIASDYEGFSEKLVKALSNRDRDIDKRVMFASQHSWDKRYEKVWQTINSNN